LDQTATTLTNVGKNLGTISGHVDSGVLSSQRAADTASLAVREITGGDSWGTIYINPLGGSNAPPVYHLSITNESKKYNLRNLIVRIIQMKPLPPLAYPQCNVGTIAAGYKGADLPDSCVLILRPGVEYTYYLLMAADNGSVTEEMRISDEGKKTSTRVTRGMPNGTVKVLKDW
jgi:hypothetical protein